MCPFGHFMPSARSIGADLLRRARRVVLESARVARLDNEVPPVAVQACPVQHVVLSVVDGRGYLSEEALAEFTRFFLETCLEQVRFMENLVQPNRLRDRILLWAEEEVRAGALPAKAGQVLEAVLFRGELPRGDLPALLNTGARQARRIVSVLLERGVLGSESTRAPLSLIFPATLAPRWMPGLFPEKTT